MRNEGDDDTEYEDQSELRRSALQVVMDLPEERERAFAVLRYAALVVDSFAATEQPRAKVDELRSRADAMAPMLRLVKQ